MKKNFLICGIAGWCLEILFTALGSLRRREMKLMGRTSLWMFPIYGMAALIGPVYSLIKKLPTLLRGLVYMVSFFGFEFATGIFLKKRGVCPWDYSRVRGNIRGVIRPDYAPWWLAAGLFYEKLLVHPAKNR